MSDADANVESRINDLLPIAFKETDNVVSPSTLTNLPTFVAGTCSTVRDDTLQMIELDYSTQDGYLAESSLIKDLKLSGKSDSKCGNENVKTIFGGMVSELQPFYYCDPNNNKTRFSCPTEFIDFEYQAQRCD